MFRTLLPGLVLVAGVTAGRPAASQTVPPPSEIPPPREASGTRQPGPADDAQVLKLLRAVGDAAGADREKALGELTDFVKKFGTGGVPAADVVSGLAPALADPGTAVRVKAVSVFLVFRDEAAVPALVKALDDESGTVRNYASGALEVLGPKAKAAIPALTANVRNGKLYDGAGFPALAAVAGKDAVPVILEAVGRDRIGPNEKARAVRALHRIPDPRAADFMARVLDDRIDTTSPVCAALIFAELGDEPSLARLRKCLAYLPLPGDDAAGPLSTKLSCTSSVRQIAVEALGRRKDKESFDAVLKMAGADPSIRVRTAAAVALGEYGNGRAVPALVAAFGEKDEGFSALGHRDGDLRRAAVRSLGRIGTDTALATLYEGMRDGPAKSHCAEFWFASKDPKHLAAFLKLFDAKPIDPDLGAGVLAGLLRTREPVKLTRDEQAKAEAEFRKAVADPTRFGPDADLSEKGKYVVRTTFTFHPDGFARVDFAFRPANPRGLGHGTSVLYRKTGEQWKPVGRVGGWVE